MNDLTSGMVRVSKRPLSLPEPGSCTSSGGQNVNLGGERSGGNGGIGEEKREEKRERRGGEGRGKTRCRRGRI